MKPSPIQAKIMAVVGYAIAFVTLLHPGWHEPVWVQAAVPALAIVISASIQVYDLVTHHVTTMMHAQLTSGPAPLWLDATWINQFIVTLITAVFGVLALIHPGYNEPAVVQAVISTLSGVVVVLIPALDKVFKIQAKQVASALSFPLDRS